MQEQSSKEKLKDYDINSKHLLVYAFLAYACEKNCWEFVDLTSGQSRAFAAE
jgi:hypothetical protein